MVSLDHLKSKLSRAQFFLFMEERFFSNEFHIASIE